MAPSEMLPLHSIPDGGGALFFMIGLFNGHSAHRAVSLGPPRIKILEVLSSGQISFSVVIIISFQDTL